jgi:predicted CoA-binding protein
MDESSREQLARIYAETKTIAVVGISRYPVDVFRPADEAPKLARQAIEIGAKVLWLQEGIESQEAKRIAEAAGLTVVMNRCMGETHAELGLGPGP